MADVSELLDRESRGDRGQLLLVGGLALAVTFIVLALVLNSAIYTENLASRGSDAAGAEDALQLRQDTRRAVAGLMEDAVATYPDTYDDPATDLDQIGRVHKGVKDVNDLTRRYASVNSRSVLVTHESNVSGTRIGQETLRNFSNRSGKLTSWDLLDTRVSNVRNFRISVSRSASELVVDPPDATKADLDGANVFSVELDDGTGDARRVYVYGEGADDVSIKVYNASSGTLSAKCTATADGGTVDIDLTRATVGGELCPALRSLDELEKSLHVRYDNGDNIAGTYEFTVNERMASAVVASNFNAYGTAPYAEPSLYATFVHVDYLSSQTHYRSDLRVAPGELL